MWLQTESGNLINMDKITSITYVVGSTHASVYAHLIGDNDITVGTQVAVLPSVYKAGVMLDRISDHIKLGTKCIDAKLLADQINNQYKSNNKQPQ